MANKEITSGFFFVLVLQLLLNSKEYTACKSPFEVLEVLKRNISRTVHYFWDNI